MDEMENNNNKYQKQAHKATKQRTGFVLIWF